MALNKVQPLTATLTATPTHARPTLLTTALSSRNLRPRLRLLAISRSPGHCYGSLSLCRSRLNTSLPPGAMSSDPVAGMY